jgi:hypothetical protein
MGLIVLVLVLAWDFILSVISEIFVWGFEYSRNFYALVRRK